MSKFNAEIEAFARNCPKTWKAISEKRYLLPVKRQADYPSQISLIETWQGCLASVLKGVISQSNHLRPEHFANQALILQGRPTYFLERELGEIMIKTPLPPAEYLKNEVKWKFPHLRVILPLNLLSAGPQGEVIHVTFLDIFRYSPNQVLKFPAEIAHELDRSRYASSFTLPSVKEHEVRFPPNEGVMVASSPDAPEDPRRQSIHFANGVDWDHLHTEELNQASTDQTSPPKDIIVAKAEHLAFNILWFLSTVPAEIVDNEETVRKPKTEGERFISGLYHARFIGQIQKSWSKTQPKTPTTSKPGSYTPHIGHWVAGHNTQQTHGPQHSLRKTQWISTYWAEGNKDQPSA